MNDRDYLARLIKATRPAQTQKFHQAYVIASYFFQTWRISPMYM